MWVVEGAFDQVGPANLEQKRLKLLKPGKSYPLGRKQKHPLQLVLSHPKISGEHVTFVVGEHPIDSVTDPTFKPTLKVQNHRNKALQVSRTVGGTVTRHLLQPSSEDEVLPSDCIALVTGIYINIHWRPVCCYLPPRSPSISFEKCASLGIKVVSTPHPEITHHLTATLSTSASLATSLVTLAHIVRPEWLTELLHLGETVLSAGGPTVLESEFRLPALLQYVPDVDSSLPAPLKSPAILEPNERRVKMFKGWRFLFVGEKGREIDAESRILVERGGGEYEVFDVSGGLTRWRQSLSRNKRKAEADGGRGISIVADTNTLKIATGDAWDGMLDELNRAGLHFVAQSKLVNAILLIDVSLINSSDTIQTERDSLLPDELPSIHEDIPLESSLRAHSDEVPTSAANAARKEHVPSPKPTTNDLAPNGALPVPEQVAFQSGEGSSSRVSQEPEGAPVRRRPLIRRARTDATQAHILGVVDPSFASFSSSQAPPSETVESRMVEKPPSSQAASSGRPSRLKKRARTDKEYNPILASLEEELAAVAALPSAQPPLKRFKALFDETDPDRVASQMANGVSGGIMDSQMFSQSTPDDSNIRQAVAGSPRAPLTTEREEEEESKSAPGQDLPKGADVQMDTDGGIPATQARDKPSSKANGPIPQVHEESFDSTQLNKHKSSKGGAAPGNPDTDAAFLQALASTKKGKRKEDDFDREFNNLRISKPERDQDAEAENWRVLADFGDDSNIRGNFMVIVEMDVLERHKESSRESSVAPSPGPDFKKFKKKTTERQRPSLELVADIGNDYGMGPAYWKGSQSQHQSQGATQGDIAAGTQQGFLQPSQTQNRTLLQPKAAPSSQAVKPRNQNPAQAEMQIKAPKAESQDIPQRGRTRPLQVVDEDDEDSEAAQLHVSKRVTNGKAKNGKSQRLFLSDDEEDRTGSAGQASNVELDLDLDDVDMSDEEPAPPTLRSTAQSSVEAEKLRVGRRNINAKKRGTVLLGDDSDTGVAFKGFGSRKKMRT